MRFLFASLVLGSILFVESPDASTALAGEVEATSLLGRPLERIEPSAAGRERFENELAEARERWASNHLEIDAIWVGRHLAYLGRYREAIEWYTERLADFPDSVRLLRHRGHRYLSTRRLDDAVGDLSRAWALAEGTEDAIEPDGLPNALGVPRSTTQTNVLYHLGLAHYLKGDFEEAARVFGTCVERSPNDDMLVAALNWRVHALRRAGRAVDDADVVEALAPVELEMDVVENDVYHRLLLLQKGLLRLDAVYRAVTGGELEDGVQNATEAYGVATWLWCEGDRLGARLAWERIVAETPWNAFGHLAAEAELARGVR